MHLSTGSGFAQTHAGYNTPPDTLSYLFGSAVLKFPDRDLIISDTDGSTFSYSDASDIVSRIMARLSAAGMEKGDRICMYSPLHVESFLLFWAAMKLGLIFVPVDFNWPHGILEKVLKEVRPRMVFCSPGCLREFSCVTPDRKRDSHTILFDPEKNYSHPGYPTFSEWLDGPGTPFTFLNISPGDEAVILYTSGSTGDPKGVVLSHGALCRSGQLVKDTFGWSSGDVFLNLGEMHAMSGLRSSAVAALHAGCSFIISSLAVRTNIFSITECIRTYGCTQLGTAPVAIRQFLQFKDRIPVTDLRSLRSVLSTGSNLSQDLMDEFHDHFGIPVLNYYGLTETTGLCLGNSLETFKNARGSIGKPIGCTADIVDHNQHSVEDGQIGELRIRSANLMSGYYHREDLTREIIRGGWLYTGDLVMKRPDGHFMLAGRKRNIIKNAYTELVHIEEVELGLERHPQIVEAAVCGYTSALGDERMAAFVVPSITPDNPTVLFRNLRTYLAAELGRHKVPAAFFLRGQLPRSSTGKLLREQLKKEIANDPEIR